MCHTTGGHGENSAQQDQGYTPVWDPEGLGKAHCSSTSLALSRSAPPQVLEQQLGDNSSDFPHQDAKRLQFASSNPPLQEGLPAGAGLLGATFASSTEMPALPPCQEGCESQRVPGEPHGVAETGWDSMGRLPARCPPRLALLELQLPQKPAKPPQTKAAFSSAPIDQPCYGIWTGLPCAGGGAQSSLDRRPALYAAGHGSLRAASRVGGIFVGTGLRTPGFCSAEAEGTEVWGASPCCPGGVTLGGAAERGPRLG